ncbi:MAG: MCE family protein [Saprospiraceae bacterium]|nr:MCE family protein [Saprospiraceae bacterium]
MTKEISRNIKLGIFVILGTLFLSVAFYLLGSKKNLFGSTIQISAKFSDVGGLQSGNNIRLGGINIGTVKSVQLAPNQMINVEMLIERKSQPYVRKNFLVSVGTDGLMGNKVVNMHPMSDSSEPIVEGDVLEAKPVVGMDEIVRSLNQTIDDASAVTKNLRAVTERLNGPNVLWNLLTDSILVDNVKQSIVNIKLTSSRTATITGDLSKIVNEVKNGKGSIGALLTDTSFANKLNQTIVNINVVSDTMALISGDLRNITRKIENGEGTLGALLLDTTFVPNLNKSMENIKSGTKGFEQNMEALKHNFLLRAYFKKQNKKNKTNSTK